jgi:hypothetical protein
LGWEVSLSNFSISVLAVVATSNKLPREGTENTYNKILSEKATFAEPVR